MECFAPRSKEDFTSKPSERACERLGRFAAFQTSLKGSIVPVSQASDRIAP